MSQNYKSVSEILSGLEEEKSIKEHVSQFGPLSESEIEKLDKSSFNTRPTKEGLSERLQYLSEKNISSKNITTSKSFDDPEMFKGNIENFIGMAQVPIGLAGPILVKGLSASGDYFIPLATTEGALVASYNRGMKACRLSGGITSVSLSEGVQRCPLFKFENIATVGLFLKWIHQHWNKFEELVTETSRYAKLRDIRSNVEGNSVILTFEYLTGDAAGQNMVTICTDKICRFILSEFSVKPKEWYIESNFSGDKKATFCHLQVCEEKGFCRNCT